MALAVLSRFGVMSDRVISASATIPAPPGVVFAILTDLRQHPRIDGSGSVRGVVRGPERLTLGASFGMDMKLHGVPYKIRNRVVELEQDRLVAWRHVGPHRWRYELEPVEGGTLVTESFDYSRYPALGALVLERLGIVEGNRRAIERTLVRLRDAAVEDLRDDTREGTR